MQLSIFYAVALLAISVVSKTHQRAACLSAEGAIDVWATEKACNAYYDRDYRGKDKDAWYQNCKDCWFDDSEGAKYCESLDKHIGGDQFAAYCKRFGADGWTREV